MPPLNVAIIGYGLSSRVFQIPLILALPESFKLYGIVQRTPKPNDDAAKDHAGIKSWRSVENMLQDSAVDVVIVSSPPEHHFSHASQALEAGKHVVVEKPFVPSSEEAHALIAIAKKGGKLITVYQNRRWDQDFLTLKQLLAQGSLGNIVELETHYDRFRPELPAAAQQTWKHKDTPAGGVLYDLGTHLIDQVYHLYGPPKSVTASVSIQKRGVTSGPPDAFTALLEYGEVGERMTVTVKSSSVSAEKEQLRYWVRGDKGSFKKFHLDMQEEHLKDGMKMGDEGFGIEAESHHGTITSVDKAGGFSTKTYPSAEPTLYAEYYRIFAMALQDQGEVPVNPVDAADVLKIIEMAIESSKIGKTIKW